MLIQNDSHFVKDIIIDKSKFQKAMDRAVNSTRKLAIKFRGDAFPSHYAENFKYKPLHEFNWESGMLCGMYLLAYEYTGEEIFKKALYDNLKVFAEHAETGQWLKTHDVGFIYSLSCVAAYKLFGDKKLRDAGIKAADILLSNYCFENNFIIRGAVRDPEQYDMYRTLVDSMMNIPLFFWASEQTGNTKYKDAAVAHYRTTMKYLIREDGSSFHHYQFDPITLKPVKGLTFQGYKDTSCWSRGHSWLIYGFPIAYSYTENSDALDTFKKVSSFYLNNLPNDNIPYWDFDFSEGSNEPRDSSAGAITACGFLEACKYIKDEKLKTIYKNAALMQLEAIIDGCSVPEDAEIIDVDGLYAGPGLIDIHAHAAGGFSYYTEPEKASTHALSHGVCDAMPALAYCLSKKEYLEAINTIDKAVKSGKFKNFLGYYMEGPYLNPNFGACREDLKWGLCAKREEYEDLIEAVKDTALVWSIAPEREGIESFVKDVKKAIPNIVFTVAHSEAPPWDIEKFIPFGLKIATHHTNATGTIINYPECRGVCVDEAVNYNDDIYAELICDSRDIHVHPYMLRLVTKIKGKDKIILISDSTEEDGPIPEGYEGVEDLNFDNIGEISGSKLTLDLACANMLVHTGCSLCDVFLYGSRNPARALSLTDRGEVKVGNIGNIIIVDHKFNVKKVILKGEYVK